MVMKYLSKESASDTHSILSAYSKEAGQDVEGMGALSKPEVCNVAVYKKHLV